MSTTTTEPIRPETVYPLPLFKQVSRMGASALRKARGQGLKIRYLGNVAFVKGSDFIQYLDQHGKSER